MRHLAVLTLSVLAVGCNLVPDVAAYQGTPDFPRESHSLLPEAPGAFDEDAEPWHYGSGVVTGEGPEQPVQFAHYTHVTKLQMQCEYCHQAARKSIHGGVPQTETCMNCHSRVQTENPEVKKVVAAYEAGEPLAWSKVHDLPDFVHFSHKRHVRAGVDCTECHGQIGLQGQTTTFSQVDHETGERSEVTGIEHVMVRETTMQMGWCLDCHAAHPSVDKNYGEKADLRRAELKDCWTCHK